MFIERLRSHNPGLAAAAVALQRGGAARTALSTYGEGVLEQPTRVVEVWRSREGAR